MLLENVVEFKQESKTVSKKNTKQILMKNKLYFIGMPFTWLYLYFKTKKEWNTILKEIDESSEIIDFLERNEFEFDDNKFIKKDIIQPDSWYDNKPYRELPGLIKKEMYQTIQKHFTDYLIINIEDYIEVSVLVEKKDNIKIWTLTLQHKNRNKLNDTKVNAILQTSLLMIATYICLFLWIK